MNSTKEALERLQRCREEMSRLGLAGVIVPTGSSGRPSQASREAPARFSLPKVRQRFLPTAAIGSRPGFSSPEKYRFSSSPASRLR